MSRRDYSTKSHVYKAPRMHVRRDKVKREIIKKRARALFFSIVFVGFTMVLGYWFFFSPLFTITDFVLLEDTGPFAGSILAEHTEVKTFTRAYTDQRVLFIFPRRNFFFFSPDTLKAQLMQKQFDPPLGEFTVNTDFPHQAFITFKRRIPRLTVVTRHEVRKMISEEKVAGPSSGVSVVKGESVEVVERTYLVDASGMVVEKDAERHIPPTLPRVVLEMSAPATFGEYDTILTASSIGAVLSLIDNLHWSWEGGVTEAPRIKEIEIKNTHPDELIVYTEEGYRIYFTLQYPLAKQIAHVQNLLPKIKERQKEITYIDMRIDNRAYVCCDLPITN